MVGPGPLFSLYTALYLQISRAMAFQKRLFLRSRNFWEFLVPDLGSEPNFPSFSASPKIGIFASIFLDWVAHGSIESTQSLLVDGVWWQVLASFGLCGLFCGMPPYYINELSVLTRNQ